MRSSNERALLGVSIGHAVHDVWYGAAPILLATLSGELSLTNADIGLILLLYQTTSALTQPFFGRLSERVGSRPLAVGSILWTTTIFSVILFAQSKLLLMACIGLAGLGSGAWHPQGAAIATIAGGARRGATSASIFFLGGTVGNAILGSALGGFLIDYFGRRAMLGVAVLTVVTALTVVRRLVPRHVISPEIGDTKVSKPSVTRIDGSSNGAFWLMLGFLLAGTLFRRVAGESLTVFFPKLQQDMGVAPSTYGLVMSVYWMATAAGGIAGSYLADRVGLRLTLAGSIALSAGALLASNGTSGLLSYALFGLSGLLVGPSHTLMMVAGQRQFPGRVATISGLFLGFSFVSGSAGAWLVGLAADRVGLSTMFSTLPWFLLVGAVLAYFGVPRPEGRTARVPQEESGLA